MSDIQECDKLSGQYAADVSKQIITLGTGALGFSCAVYMNGKIEPWLAIASMSAFGITILFGILFIMRMVGKLGLDSEIKVYGKGLRLLSILQIVSFLLGITFISISVMRFKGANSDANHISIKTSAGQFEYPNASSQGVKITISTDGKIDFETK